mgnify:CR=1 FL=1
METAVALADTLHAALTAAGYRHRVAPAGMVETLDRDIQGLREQGLLSQSLYSEYSESFTFSPPAEVSEPRTLIAVAWPSPAVKVRFHLDSGPLEAVIPPTYVSSVGRARCLEIMQSVLGEAGYGVARARVPNKLLAAKTGLARYGRNNLAFVEGDPGRIAQVLSNLVDNAASFSPPGATVGISVRADGGFVVVLVTDEGPGIAGSDTSRIFDRFYSDRPDRDGGARSGAGAHAGLGLAIVKAIVELHGGQVEAQSAGRGQGSRFSVTLFPGSLDE